MVNGVGKNMSEQKNQDQAEKLREYKDDEFMKEDWDVLDLPPRKDVHQEGKTKWKFSTVWMRFLLVVFITIIIVLLSYQYWDEWFGETFLDPSILQEEAPYHEEITVER